MWSVIMSLEGAGVVASSFLAHGAAPTHGALGWAGLILRRTLEGGGRWGLCRQGLWSSLQRVRGRQFAVY